MSWDSCSELSWDSWQENMDLGGGQSWFVITNLVETSSLSRVLLVVNDMGLTDQTRYLSLEVGIPKWSQPYDFVYTWWTVQRRPSKRCKPPQDGCFAHQLAWSYETTSRGQVCVSDAINLYSPFGWNTPDSSKSLPLPRDIWYTDAPWHRNIPSWVTSLGAVKLRSLQRKCRGYPQHLWMTRSLCGGSRPYHKPRCWDPSGGAPCG